MLKRFRPSTVVLIGVPPMALSITRSISPTRIP